MFLFCSLKADILYDIYQNAIEGHGYDKHMILNSEIIYTGGFGTSVYSVFLDCNGATIDLEQGTGIWMSGDLENSPSILIKNCTIINGGYYGVNLSGYGEHEILDCNFINDNWGIQVGENTLATIRNCNLIGNTYGLAIIGLEAEVNLSYCNGWENSETYMSNCPG